MAGRSSTSRQIATPEQIKAINPMGLRPWGILAKTHWEKHRPRMVAHLKRQGVYRDALVIAQEKAVALAAALAVGGLDGHQAQWEGKLTYLLLPAETEQAHLDHDLMPFSQPEPITASLASMR